MAQEYPRRERPRTGVAFALARVTGGTGRHLVAQALERGHAVTALVRLPSALRVEHPRLHVMRGDVLDYPSVEAAMQRQEVVLCTLGHKRFFQPTRILSEGTRNIMRAMETHVSAAPGVCWWR